MLVREIAQALGAPFEGDGDREIVAAAPVDSASAGQLSFVTGKKARSSAAGCLLVSPDYPGAGSTLIRVADPRGAFARAIRLLHPEPPADPGIHPTAVVAPGAQIGEGVSVGAHSTVGEGARIGAGSRIGAGCAIGRDSTLGEQCRLHANVTIYDNVTVGARAILHAGCVLGADGFGFVPVGGRWEKFPQIGTVVLGDDVEVGANSCIDRGALGATTVGDGTKLDNMVHVGHNCAIGRHCVVAAQTGFSGGVVVEDHAIIGGQVGIGDKARIESRAVLGSGCGVLTSKIVRAGEPVWGTPARPLKQYLRVLAEQAKLPEYRDRLKELEERVAALERAGR